MSALILFAFAAIWLGVGYLVWRLTIARFAKSAFIRVVLGSALAAAWLAAPWVDEWLGAREFKRLCDEMPEVKFLGPVSVGVGPFFDEHGRRLLWTQREIEQGHSPFPTGDIKLAYLEGRKFYAAWQREFKSAEHTQRIREWPIPVVEGTVSYVHGSAAQLVLVSHSRVSAGGWIKRITGWGAHAPYQCAKKTAWPQESDWIKY